MSRHPFDPVSFVCGVLFAGVAAAAMAGPERLRLVEPTLAGPALLVLLGLLVLVSSTWRRAPAAEEPEADATGSASGSTAEPEE